MVRRTVRVVSQFSLGLMEQSRSSFQYISSSLQEKLIEQAHDQLFLNQVIHWYTDDVQNIEVEHQVREKKSGYSFSLVLLRSNSFSSMPIFRWG